MAIYSCEMNSTKFERKTIKIQTKTYSNLLWWPPSDCISSKKSVNIQWRIVITKRRRYSEKDIQWRERHKKHVLTLSDLTVASRMPLWPVIQFSHDQKNLLQFFSFDFKFLMRNFQKWSSHTLLHISAMSMN